MVIRTPLLAGAGCGKIITDPKARSSFKELRIELEKAFPELTVEII